MALWSAGMSSTQLGESFNAKPEDYLRADRYLLQFFWHFGRVLSDERYNEFFILHMETLNYLRSRFLDGTNIDLSLINIIFYHIDLYNGVCSINDFNH